MSNNFFHAPKFRHVVCNINDIYEVARCWRNGYTAQDEWVEYFKTLHAVHWNAVVKHDGQAIYLVSTIGGGYIHPMGFSFALNCESDINYKHLTDELTKVIGTIVERMGGTAHFEIA